MAGTRLIFLDTETTSLDRRKREIWDIAYIIRDYQHEDIERQFFLDPPMKDADPTSLKIGGYWERHPNWKRTSPKGVCLSEYSAARRVAQDFLNAHIIGAVPSFDEETLYKFLRSCGIAPTWHYHLIDIESMAAAAVGLEPPYNFDKLLAEFGLTYNEEDRHTALGDARMVRDLYDKIFAITK
jgi:DNA polymerase III epsilon subunit-like protein